MNLDGSVISVRIKAGEFSPLNFSQASGDLEGDRKAPAVLFRALQDTNAIITSADKPVGFKKLTSTQFYSIIDYRLIPSPSVSFSDFSYRVTVSQKKVFVVKVRS